MWKCCLKISEKHAHVNIHIYGLAETISSGSGALCEGSWHTRSSSWARETPGEPWEPPGAGSSHESSCQDTDRARSISGHLLPQRATLGSESDMEHYRVDRQSIVHQLVQADTASKEECHTGRMERLEAHITQQVGATMWPSATWPSSRRVGTHQRVKAAAPAGGTAPSTPAVADAFAQMGQHQGEAAV